MAVPVAVPAGDGAARVDKAGTRPGQAAASPGRGRGAVGGWDQQG